MDELILVKRIKNVDGREKTDMENPVEDWHFQELLAFFAIFASKKSQVLIRFTLFLT